MLLLIIANVVNIGADLGAMAASLNMLTGVNFYLAAFFSHSSLSFSKYLLISCLCEILEMAHYVRFRLYLRALSSNLTGKNFAKRFCSPN